MAIFTPDMTASLLPAAVALCAVAVISLAALRGWRDWIALKRDELAALRTGATEPAMVHSGSRIEIADLKERLRKLEAIAAGVDP